MSTAAPLISESPSLPTRDISQVTTSKDRARTDSWEALERQDWHLWMLAVLLMAVLGVSLLSFMFPTIFWFGEELPLKAPQRAFVGFSVLLALALVYMLQRQAAVRRLKRKLYQAQAAVIAAERTVQLQAFVSLPGAGQFRDSLAMEYLRASHSSGHLAVLLAAAPGASPEDLGRVAAMVRVMLRDGEALFRVAESAFALLLPGMSPQNASTFSNLLPDRIGQLCPAMQVTVSVAVYPEQVTSLAEFEGMLRRAVE